MSDDQIFYCAYAASIFAGYGLSCFSLHESPAKGEEATPAFFIVVFVMFTPFVGPVACFIANMVRGKIGFRLKP